MITIRIDHTWCNIAWEFDPEESVVITEACSYSVADAWMSSLFQKGWWDGKKSLLKKTRGELSGKFPTGILFHVVSELKSKPFQRIHIEDTRVYPQIPTSVDSSLITFDLRDYQREATEAALSARKGILKLPTGAGKTKTMIAILAAIDRPTLWITHEGHLARQTQKAMSEGVFPPREIGMYRSGDRNIKRWTVALVQSLSRRVSELTYWLEQVDVLVLDECHHGAATTWYDTAMAIPARFRFGCSATPFERSDRSMLELMGCCGQVIYEREAGEVKQYLSRPIVEMIHMPRTPIIAFNWQDVYKQGIVENEVRNRALISRIMIGVRARLAGIVFVSSLAHGDLLYSMLADEIGVSCLHVFMNGNTPQSVRDEYYDRLKTGDLLVLIATDGVAGEGQDIPAVACVIIGGGLKAAIIVKQRIGRGMRPTEIGEGPEGWGGEVHIYDFVDNQHPKLLAHSDQRRGHYAAVGAVIEENYSATTTRG